MNHIPAFPQVVSDQLAKEINSLPKSERWDVAVKCMGMTLRDYFAGNALAGYFAAPNTPHMNADEISVAQYCYSMADAMIMARKASGLPIAKPLPQPDVW